LRKGRVSQIGTVYHITTVTKSRTPLFASLDNGRKVVRELMALQAEGRAETLCYVVMPDHLHCLMVLYEGKLSGADAEGTFGTRNGATGMAAELF
jgi:putative transposase